MKRVAVGKHAYVREKHFIVYSLPERKEKKKITRIYWEVGGHVVMNRRKQGQTKTRLAVG